MKKISILFQIAFLVSFFACKHTDQNLIHHIQKEASLQNQSAVEFAGVQNEIMTVLAAANLASPEEMQNPVFQDVVKQASVIEAKAKISNEEFLANSNKLTNLANAYASGKITKESVEKEFAALKTDSVAVKKLLSTLNNMLDSTQAKWTKMMPR
jgi:hypothetical protein